MNGGYVYEEVLGTRAAGQTVLDWLAARYTHTDRQGWIRHLEAGRVTLDGVVVREGGMLAPEQVLAYHREPWEEPDAPLTVEVVYEDAHLVALHKPSGLPTLPGGGFLEHTLLHVARERFPGISPVHRLGRFTSGLVLCGRTPETVAHLSAQLADRSVHKRYRALATGDPSWECCTVRQPIGPVPYAPLGWLHAASEKGKASHSEAMVIERRGVSTLMDVVIHTGRPHQIRIHLASVGHPLLGDPLYGVGGGPLPGTTAVPGDPGYLLHAAEVRVRHPQSQAPLTLSAVPPLPLRKG